MTTAQKTETAEVQDKIQAAEFSKTLNGFDQLAIQKFFSMRFDQLQDDALTFLRALWFIKLQRDPEKPKAAEAYKAAMEVTLGDLTGKFDTKQKVDGYDDDPEAEADEGFATFIIGTGLNYTFAQYMELTVQQRAKIVDAANKKNRRR